MVLLGYQWICRQIVENKRLRSLVPRVYGLGDLTQILDERAYSQAKALLDSQREELSKVVLTSTYTTAATALYDHSFVLLLGEPASGKTTIAMLLALAAIDNWNCSLVKVDTPSEIKNHWNPDEPHQFFWIDDAFGVTQYQPSLSRDWNRQLSLIQAALRNGARIVMTSRDYIYRSARRDLKTDSFPLINEAQVVIEVEKLAESEKEQMIYNHLKMGRQSREFKAAIKPYLPVAAKIRGFLPETARRLGDPYFTKPPFKTTQRGVIEFFERPLAFASSTLATLDRSSIAALAVLYMAGGTLQVPVTLDDGVRSTLVRLQSNEGLVIEALSDMHGSFVTTLTNKGETFWAFKHPTIGDAIAAYMGKSPDLIDIYLQGASYDRIVSEVTCGVPVEGSFIDVPQNRYAKVIDKLLNVPLGTLESKRNFDYFLIYRCGSDFLQALIRTYPVILNRIARPGLMLNSVSDIDLALHLHELGLLPGDIRLSIVRTLTEYVVDFWDCSPLENSDYRRLFLESEFETLLSRTKSELVPNINAKTYDWIYSYVPYNEEDSFSGREAEGDRIFEHLDAIVVALPETKDTIEIAKNIVREWIRSAEQIEYDDLSERSRLAISRDDNFQGNSGSRNIFEDVDF